MNIESQTEITMAEQLDIQQTSGPGSRLRYAREKAKLSVEDVARTLYLNTSLVEAMEADNYASNMPGIAFIRGYLRAYARLLDLPQQEILKQFENLGIVDKPASMSTQEIYKKQSSVFEKALVWFTLIILIVVMLLVFLWWRSLGNDASQIPITPAAKPNKTLLNNTDAAIPIPQPDTTVAQSTVSTQQATENPQKSAAPAEQNQTSQQTANAAALQNQAIQPSTANPETVNARTGKTGIASTRQDTKHHAVIKSPF